MKTLCWIRRDLRLHDHAALSHALAQGETTIIFVFDPHILKHLPTKEDRRITFIMDSLKELEEALQKKGSSLLIEYGDPVDVIPRVAQELKVNQVVSNRDYEASAKTRDEKVAHKLKALGIGFQQFKDSVFFEKHEVLSNTRTIYKVFTPYKNKWLEEFKNQGKTVSNFECPLKNLRQFKNPKNILHHDWYKETGFVETPISLPGGTKAGLKRLKDFSEKISRYKTDRDFPSIDGTSYLSVYIRHGAISIRDMIRAALEEDSEGSSTWLSELIWRDFYQMILDTHPFMGHKSFKPEYDQIKWLGTKEHFEAWCRGETGFPIVDAAMRCFNQTGMMHNRLRMIVASFLCKILLVDWRLGEKYFADYLLDFDLAANNGGWQWSSSSGCDAQPYFRIFNPYTQSEKFDPDGTFIKNWIPELQSADSKSIHKPDLLMNPDYVSPIVSYEKNRQRCLEMYAVVKK